MILRRMGTKTRVVKKSNILQLLPQHTMFIDMFFGAGGFFFNKPKAKHNICNDYDSEVYNLYQVLITRKTELEEAIYQTPYHSDLFKYWIKNTEIDPVIKAVRFLMLSNYSYLGKGDTLRFSFGNSKKCLINNIEKTFDLIHDVYFMNYDFRDVLSKISIKGTSELDKTFIYADPPYLGTENNYGDNCKFKQKDSEDLFHVLVNSGYRFAISEFNNPVILDLARHHGLEVINLMERRNINNRRNEILIINYDIDISQQKLELK